MLFHGKQCVSLVTLAAALTLLTLPAIGCRGKSQPAIDAEPGVSGEPENYSATVVQAIDDGTERELNVSRIVRSGELRREEWVEQGDRRALILRPDEGKAFLLALDERKYMELPLSSGIGFGGREREPESLVRTDKQTAANHDISGTQSSDGAQRAIDPETIDRAIDDAPAPVRVETRALADQIIENHACKVYEQRAIFADGHAEVTKIFRAPDLAGLAIRIETAAEPQNENVKVIILRRDIKTDVSPDEFVVPAGFKKVDKLLLR